MAVSRDGTVGYGLGYDWSSGNGYIAVCDLVRFELTRVIFIGSIGELGRLSLSPDGRKLVGIVDSGLVLIRLPGRSGTGRRPSSWLTLQRRTRNEPCG